MNEGWHSIAEEDFPDRAGCVYLVSALNCYNQRDEFLAYTGYGDYPFRWYTYDLTKMQNRDTKDTTVSDKWRVTHWRELDRLDVTELRKESGRPKSERYICTHCGGICYFPHSKHTKIWYKFCPNCGRELNQHE